MDTADRRQPSPGSHVRGLPAESLARIAAATRNGEYSRFATTMAPSALALLSECGFSPRGIALGSSIVHVEIPYGGYSQNQELTAATRALASARQEALERLREEAERLRADGVINVELDVRPVEWAESTLECTARGDAVNLRRADAPNACDRPFMTTFAAVECNALFEARLRPAHVVFGNCVYHIAHQGFMQSIRQTGVNSEVPKYSQAVAGARESALARMEQDANDDEICGVLDVRIEQTHHEWRSHVSEYTALGNAVVPLDARLDGMEFRKHRAK